MRLLRAALLSLAFFAAAPAARAAVEGAQPAPAGSPGPAAEPGAPGAPGGSPRLESELPRRCGVCHLDKAPPVAPGAIAFAVPARSREAGQSGMCYSCHNGLVLDGRRTHWGGRNHPAAGRVQCGSCHTPHLRSPNLGPFMRHAAGDYGFCASCHPGRAPGAPGEHPAVVGERGRRQDCGSCHAVHGATGAGLVRGESAEGLCRGCHGDNPSREGRGPGAQTHLIGGKGPACFDCHRSHGGGGGGGARAMLARAVLDGRICRQCHERQFSAARGEENHPTAPEKAGCLSCHRLHNAAKPAGGRGRLLASAWAEAETICTACHAALAVSGEGGWNHPVGAKVSAKNRIQGERLARAGAYFGQGGKITCFSCHRSHKGLAGTPQLLVPKQALCLYCHPEQNAIDPERAALGAHPVSVRPRRASIDASFLRAGGETGAGGELTCKTCHRAHGAQAGTKGMVLGPDAYSCLLCHRDETGVASTAHSAARAPGAPRGRGGGICGGCHGEHGWRLPIPPPAGPEDRSTAVDRLCASCHGIPEGASFGGATNHPIGVPPSAETGPAGLPLFWEDGRRLRGGVIGCATCHDVHRPGARGSFLRAGRRGGDLCVGCHGPQSVVLGTKHDLTAGGGTPCGSCHKVHDIVASAAWPALAGGGARDRADLSGLCGECHRAGGAAAKSVVKERAHPASAALGGGKGSTGVGCGGCHDPHRWNPSDPADRGAAAAGDASTSFLVRPASRPAELCKGCHPEAAVVAGTPHDLDGTCAPCHRVHGGDATYLWSAALAATRGEKRDPCEACHAAGRAAGGALPGLGHPVGVSPGQDFGPDLPLFGPAGRRQSSGRMTCSTCHDPHRWAPPGGSGAPTPAATSFLRLGADGYAPLCFPCHAEKSMVVGTDHDLRVTAPQALNRAGADAEASGVCGACHAVHRAAEGYALWNRALGEGKDAPSRACRSCHRAGSDAGARQPVRLEAHLVRNPGGGPPAGRTFAITRGAAPVPTPIPLFAANGTRSDEGHLSCASCHDVHRWESDVNSSGSGVPVEGDLGNSFLRVRNTFAIDRSFCRECHAETTMQLYRTYHFPEAK